MSGGPPHHPAHGRQGPPANTAWNHLQVPNYFPPRQPQHAHMSNEPSLLHQPTWHTPTTEPLKPSHSHIFSLEQMLAESRHLPPRHAAPGVDLSLTRNGAPPNGDLLPSATPLSLSVRDTNKINSLPPSALDIQPLDIKPLTISPSLPTTKSKKRVDSILERLNPNLAEAEPLSEDKKTSVIVQAATSHDENSNSTPRDDEVVSPYSNEDSLDSNKSRRKRKPSKTIRVTKEETKTEEIETKIPTPPQRRRSSDDVIIPAPAKNRRKTSSESETIDNIAAMVQEGLAQPETTTTTTTTTKAISVSVIKTKEDTSSQNDVTTTEANKTTAQFVEVENKLEEMFAGIDEPPNKEPSTSTENDEESKKIDDNPVTSTSNDLIMAVAKKTPKKGKRKQQKKKTVRKQLKITKATPTKTRKILTKIDAVKDVYAYDSGSNASSSKSRGPFIQIRGPRDSPLSVSVINTPTNEDDPDKVKTKSKKYHDDSEYRHKVRSRGLHSSTLSHQYDAQTKDISWICVFCKRGPHATDTTGPTLNTAIPAAGDLFGPYFITTNSAEFERRLDDPFDKQFKSKKIARSIGGVGDVFSKSNGGNKRKRKHSLDVDEVYVGITDTGNGTFEIWAHEECIVWSSGIYLIGPKIVGLEEAVWTCCNVVCVKCHLKGANICCLKRGCCRVAHICCARLMNWQFDEDSYKTYCPDHRVSC